MISYKDYEQKVYDWLKNKNNQEPTFTFSLRLKASKGAENDYFIGTEKSNYFSTTFWYLPVGFPGSSGDCIGLQFYYTKTGYNYFFEFTQTKAPEGEQNIAALELVKEMQTALSPQIAFQKLPTADAKMFTIRTKTPKGSYASVEEMFDDVEKDIIVICPIVDAAIDKIKIKYPSFNAHRITPSEFEVITKKFDERISKYASTGNEDDDIDFYEFIKKFEAKDLTTYFDFLKEIVDTFGLKIGDERLLFSCRQNRLNLTIGQRYSFYLNASNKRQKFGILSRDKLREKSEQYSGGKNASWFSQMDELQLSNDEKESVIEGFYQELERSAKSSYRIHNNNAFEKAVFEYGVGNGFNGSETSTPPESEFPLNQILYGPPGTGKTYTLKNDYFSKYTLKETSITKELFFEETVRSLTWWQVIALALLENGTSRVNEILANRWVALKAELSESKNVRATLWGTLQMHTIQESKTVAYTQRQTPFVFDKKEDKSWMLLEVELKEQSPELYDVLNSVNNFKANPQNEIKHYVFTTFHQSFSYEDFIEGIKPKMEDETETHELTYKIEPGIFKELCSRAQSDPSNRYAIFIDEINRGNVSQIFGELITLIEIDKRIGAVNEMKVKLPYSKKEFGVPSNVDIYGTMNTADRSVEALDTALRRRFSFKELMPDVAVVAKKNFNDYPRVAIMEKINNRIELLLDRNHTLGHAYFIKQDFKNSCQNEIIPLLQEYFYNDYGKIGLVLGKGFVREKIITKSNDKSIFADFETKNEVDIIKSYELIPFYEVEFDSAIQTLLT